MSHEEAYRASDSVMRLRHSADQLSVHAGKTDSPDLRETLEGAVTALREWQARLETIHEAERSSE